MLKATPSDIHIMLHRSGLYHPREIHHIEGLAYVKWGQGWLRLLQNGYTSAKPTWKGTAPFKFDTLGNMTDERH